MLCICWRCIKQRTWASNRVLSKRSCSMRRSCSLVDSVRCIWATRSLRLAISAELSDSDELRACTCRTRRQTAVSKSSSKTSRRYNENCKWCGREVPLETGWNPLKDVINVCYIFYRAMLCISAVYAGMRCLSVCQSVCLFVTFVDHVKTNKHIFEIFSPSGSHAILVFPHQTAWRCFNNQPNIVYDVRPL